MIATSYFVFLINYDANNPFLVTNCLNRFITAVESNLGSNK